MTSARIEAASTIEASDHPNLRSSWREYGGPSTLVGRFIVDKPLTASQLRRLPEALKARLYCPDDSVDFPERLYGLPDPRDAE